MFHFFIKVNLPKSISILSKDAYANAEFPGLERSTDLSYSRFGVEIPQNMIRYG